jgi:class 3 adenylate cyclase/CheY-like chemotaxis protein
MSHPEFDAEEEPFAFADEETVRLEAAPVGEWHVLVVDDDPHVHTVTTLALEGLRVDGARLVFDHAHSGPEAREKLSSGKRYALVLLDVVMDTEHAGLLVARWLRNERQERLTRIVLRTGQPGLAPERDVMLEYDINDYQPKTELSSQRLATSVIGAIRSYRDLTTLEAQKSGLEKIVLATASLFERRSTEQLIAGLLEQIAGLLGPAESAVLLVDPFEGEVAPPLAMAGTGRFAPFVGRSATEALDPSVQREVAPLLRERRSGRGLGWTLYAVPRSPPCGPRTAAVLLEPGLPLNPWKERLLELFCENAGAALDNQLAHASLERTARACERFLPQRALELVGASGVGVSGGEHVHREMTVLVAEVRSIAALGERRGAAAMFGALHRWYSAVVPLVEAEGGVVDLSVGDRLLAVFPSPSDGAVRAALALVDASDRVFAAETDASTPATDLQVQVGLHRGPTLLGVTRVADHLGSTVVSDAAHVAARLARLPQSAGRVVASDAVVSASSPLWPQATPLGDRPLGREGAPLACLALGAKRG